MHSTPEVNVEQLAQSVAHGLNDGSLTLRQAVGLTAEEMTAVRRRAETYRRRGELDQAIGVYGLLLMCDPFDVGLWEQMARLQQQTKQHAVALSCYVTLELLGYDERTARRRQIQCLEKMGQPELAQEVAAHGYHDARPERELLLPA